MVSGPGIALALALAALVWLAFSLDPGLDLGAARLFYEGGGRFAGATPLGVAARNAMYYVPAALLAGAAALWLARRLRGRGPAPSP